MILGSTRRDKQLKTEKKREEYKNIRNQLFFAWFPIRLDDGRFAWMQYVYKTYQYEARGLLSAFEYSPRFSYSETPNVRQDYSNQGPTQ